MSKRSGWGPRRFFMCLAVSAGFLATASAEPAPTCENFPKGVLIDTSRRTLMLCKDRAIVKSYDVALGLGGVGKQKQGDNKVPLGVYSLERGRPSSQFHTFILIGYPTKEQRQQGYTGSAVGIHGPPRESRLEGKLNTQSDWTWGCIAVGSDPEIDDISNWLNRNQAHTVRIF